VVPDVAAGAVGQRDVAKFRCLADAVGYERVFARDLGTELGGGMFVVFGFVTEVGNAGPIAGAATSGLP
jgi:hypothetical protein